eukprot:COSAG01_NODE_11409_length_1941_cov_18.481542_1_plen_184_part_00
MLHALAVMSLRTDIELSNIVDHEPFQVFAGALSAEGLASSGAAATNSSSSSTGGGGGGGESPGGSSGRDAAALPTDPTAGISLHLTGDHGSEEDEEDATAHTGASTPSKTMTECCLWAAVCLRTMLLLSGSVRPSVSHPGGIGGVLMPRDRMRTDGELVTEVCVSLHQSNATNVCTNPYAENR